MDYDQYLPPSIKRKMADSSLSHLPHPKRMESAGSFDLVPDGLLKNFVGAEEWPQLRCELADISIGIPTLVRLFQKKYPGMRTLVDAAIHDMNNAGLGAFEMQIITDRLRLAPPRLYKTTGALDSMLAESDIADGMPCSVMRLPFPFIYIEFGETRTSKLTIKHRTSGSHILEGAYAHETFENGVRQLHVTIVGSPAGKNGPLDDAYLTGHIDMPDEAESLDAALERMYLAEKERPLMGAQKTNDSEASDYKKCVQHVAKALLYINSSESRIEIKTDWSDLAEALKRSGTSKKSKIQRKMDKAYDHIVVGEYRYEEGINHEPNGGGAQSPHWRRGHFRNQRCGPSLKESKVIWIRPTLINAQDAIGLAVKTKDYLVK